MLGVDMGILEFIRLFCPVNDLATLSTQTYFLWVSAKDCIHIHLDLTR